MQTKHATVWKNIFLKSVFIDMILIFYQPAVSSALIFLTLLIQDITAVSQS